MKPIFVYKTKSLNCEHRIYSINPFVCTFVGFSNKSEKESTLSLNNCLNIMPGFYEFYKKHLLQRKMDEMV